MNFHPIQMGRPLINSSDLFNWIDQSNLKGTDVKNFHVTLAYSSALVDWDREVFSPRNDVIEIDNGHRSLEIFDGKLLVLEFESALFQNRWRELKEGGASWDFDKFTPHVTLKFGVNDEFSGVLDSFTFRLNRVLRF